MNAEIKTAHPNRVLIVTILMTLIVGSAVDIFVPSLPHIAAYFKTSASLARLAVTVYLISYGVFQLIYGSLADTFGRKKIAVLSLAGYIVCTYLVVLSQSIYFFLMLRLLQGAFTAGLGVINRAILSDCFAGKTLSKYASYILIAWAAGPIASPYIGGYMQLYFGWQANFYLLTGYSFIVFLIAITLLPETCRHYTRLNLRHFYANYKIIFLNKYFIAGALICGFMYGFITVYNVAGPFLVQVELGFSPAIYGKAALFLGVSWLAGILAFRYMTAKFSGERLIFTALIIACCISAIWFLLGALNLFNLLTTILPAVLLFACGAVVFSSSFAKTVSLFPTVGGSASAALGAVFSIISGFSSGGASFLEANSLLPISLAYLGLILISYIIFRKFNKSASN